MYIALTKPQIQFMIARNKQQITELEEFRKEIEDDIQFCWKGADPLSTSVDSQSAFSTLNLLKNDLRKVQSEIKKLSEIQKALKVAASEA